MTDEATTIRDKALEDTKANYLIEMKKTRAEYFKCRTTLENAYTKARNRIWKGFWEDVG